jgi:small subunit ribosomal protein S12
MPTITQLSNKCRKPRRYKNKRLDLRRCPQKKGICVKAFYMTPRKPNSALRKVAFVLFRRWKWKVLVYVPGEYEGDKHPLQKYAVVLIRGGRVKDLPGMKYTIICGKFDLRRIADRRNARSKYGMVKTYDRVDHRYRKFSYN